MNDYKIYTNVYGVGGQSGSAYHIVHNNGNYVAGILTHNHTNDNWKTICGTSGVYFNNFIYHYLNSFVVNHNVVYKLETIQPSDYGFEGEYNFNNIETDIVLNSGYKFSTNRLRCGYITYEGESYLTLSAKRKDAGVAYLEYSFEDEIYSIDYNLALWSENEALNQNSSIQLQYLDELNNWVTAKTFDTGELSKSKDELTSFSYDFAEPVNDFRFYITTNAVNNENNRGRVVIGEMSIYTYAS